jgi:hypothetical protein
VVELSIFFCSSCFRFCLHGCLSYSPLSLLTPAWASCSLGLLPTCDLRSSFTITLGTPCALLPGIPRDQNPITFYSLIFPGFCWSIRK